MKFALSRPSPSRKQCGPGGVEGNCPDHTSVTTVSKAAANHAFVGAQVCVPVADVERERFPVVGDTGGPSACSKAFGSSKNWYPAPAYKPIFFHSFTRPPPATQVPEKPL